MKKNVPKFIDAIKVNAVDVISEEELTFKLESSLKEGRPLNLKIGFDPTASDVHLGHTVLLRKLRILQNLGHQVVLIIGDFTAKIGDPSGKTVLRPVLNDEEIKVNASTYTDQALKILDKEKTKVVYNSSWYKKMAVSELFSILSSYTVARMLERDDFSQRFKEGRPLTILEFVYPLIQGYDSVMCCADIEFGGTDQKFNLLVGRAVQHIFNQSPQVVVTMPLLVGLDGKDKMSKSLGNFIGVTDKPKDMFGKIMSVSDEVMWEYFRLLTDCNLNEMRLKHPKEAKLSLADQIVSFYYSDDVGKKTREDFERVFSHREIPEDLPVFSMGKNTFDILEALYKAGVVTSKNEARRLLQQGSICSVEAKDPSRSYVLKDKMVSITENGIVVKVGKRRFVKFII